MTCRYPKCQVGRDSDYMVVTAGTPPSTSLFAVLEYLILPVRLFPLHYVSP
ncbi:hypothetical protein J6590_089093 [Homalodisca vitripennis]|nr:hypothetical protein J6590_089093 [Homalodisca vitripennis]